MPALARIHRKRSGRSYVSAEGREYVSVTNYLSVIAKPALIGWAAKVEREMVVGAAVALVKAAPVPINVAEFERRLVDSLGKHKASQKKLAEATEIGSQVHALIEWTLRKELSLEVGDKPLLRGDPANIAFEAYLEWRKTVNLEPLEIEQEVHSDRYGFAGTLDLVALLDLPQYGRTRAILDWKTGAGIYSEAKLQNVAYSWAHHEMGRSENPLPGLIVRLPKTPSDKAVETLVIETKDHEWLMQVFEAARTLWHWQRLEDSARLIQKGIPDD